VEGVEEEGKREGGVEGDEEEGKTEARVEDGEKRGGRMRSEVGDWEDRKEGDLSSSRCVRLMSDEEVSSSTSGLGGAGGRGAPAPPPSAPPVVLPLLAMRLLSRQYRSCRHLSR
jgi:hypothetical protein